jgi:serine protease AprX
MNKKITFSLITLFFLVATGNAQFNRYIVRFKDKSGTGGTIANPSAYLSTKAIDRRTKYNISIDSTDLPLVKRYLDSIRLIPGVIILNTSKWLNQVAISTTNPAAITKINAFPFVLNATGIAPRLMPLSLINKNEIIQTNVETGKAMDLNNVQLNYGGSFNQINMHNGQFLHDQGFLGQNMSIAMMDAGFNSYLTNAGIDSLRINNQIKATWDFVARDTSVNEDDSHGFFCLSIFAANKTGVMIGTAPKANYYLYRTEDVASEYPIEEQNWIAAAERADSIGVDVFSTSLGYLDFDNTLFDYAYTQRNGNYAMMTIAADLAARKGIIVCNSAGNNGNGAPGNLNPASPSLLNYKYIAIPADGDSVFTVGACNASGVISTFSAWGPNSNGKVKPNVTSMGQGTAFINLGGTVSNGNGTSFSNPNIAGLITDLWQAFPEVNNMGIIDLMHQSSHIFNAPDGRYGYGIPNMKKAYVLGLKKTTTNAATISGCKVNINFSAKDNGTVQYKLERKLTGETAFTSIKSWNASSGAFALKNYNVKDTIVHPTTGLASYRIQHVMGTDTSFYYDEFTVNYNSVCVVTPVIPVNVFKIKIAPNPIKNSLLIDLGSLITNKLMVKVIAPNGSIIYKNIYNNVTNLSINAANWATGFYTVELWNYGKLEYSKKVLKN